MMRRLCFLLSYWLMKNCVGVDRQCTLSTPGSSVHTRLASQVRPHPKVDEVRIEVTVTAVTGAVPVSASGPHVAVGRELIIESWVCNLTDTNVYKVTY